MNNLRKHFLCGTDKNLHSGRLCGAIGLMTSAVKVKPGFTLAELDLERRLADEASYQQKLSKLQIAMRELED